MGKLRGEHLPGRGSREEHVQRKERVTGPAPGEAARGWGGGRVSESSDFLLWAQRSLWRSHKRESGSDLHPWPCGSSRLLTAAGTDMKRLTARGPGVQGCWWPLCKLWQWLWRRKGELRSPGEAARLRSPSEAPPSQ